MSNETFGEYLKRERLLRQISLEEVAEGTKIAIHMLRAIEEDSWEDIPGEVFRRGFVKSYAEFIGLEPEEVLLRYQEERAKEDQQADKPSETLALEEGIPRIQINKRPSNLLWLILIVLVILAGVFYWLFFKS